MPILFRPHHFLCALTFQGKGYSKSFIKNFKKIAALLNAPLGDQTTIEVTAITDDICAPCPHRTQETCASQAIIDHLDAAHAQQLQIKSGDQLTWQEAKTRIKSNFTLDKFHEICAPCEWKKFGMCEQVLKNFLDH